MADAVALIDLNTEFPDGTTSIRAATPSEDGRYFAYGLSSGGTDWTVIKVRDVATGAILPDTVPWVKFSGISWSHDGKGFFYSRYPTPEGLAHEADKDGATGEAAKSAGTEVAKNEHHMVYWHTLGTSADQDRKVFDIPEHPLWNVGASVTDDGATLLISVFDGCNPTNQLFYLDLSYFWEWLAVDAESAGPLRVVRLIDNFDGKFEYLANDGRKFYFLSNLAAPRNRIVSITLPEPGSPVEVDAAALAAIPIVEELPQSADPLEWAMVVGGDKLILCYLHDVIAVLEQRLLHNIAAAPARIELPAPGTISGASGRRDSPLLFCKFTSFVHPGTILKVDVAEGSGSSVQHYVTTVPGFDPAGFETTQDFVTSKDGARVPVFYVRAKRAEGAPVEPRPCLLYGYGGFSISLCPSFSSTRLVWLQELGGVYAQACIRGGSEYGEEWHTAGSLLNKQNCFNDFIAAAEHLVAKGITSPERLCIQGGSNGGLLVLACALQRPALYRAVVAQVAVADMLRFMRFTIGHAWCSEYGNPDKSKEDFDNVMKFSPLHNIRAPTSDAESLPAMLVCTADHDDRVVPLHSFKTVATLQHVAGASPHQLHPLLIYIDKKAGHGAGKPTSKILDEAADSYAFIAHQLGAIFA